MAYSRWRSSASSEWGELFGLTPADLTDEQLDKVSFRKLIELANQDTRVEKVLGDKMLKATKEDLEHLARLEDAEVKELPYLVSQYNKCLRERGPVLEKEKSKKYYDNRSDYVFWRLMNKSNKGKEFARWIDGKDSIVDSDKIDYEWLFQSYPWIADQVVNKILKGATGYNKNSAIRMVCNLPEEPTKRYVEQICEKDKSIYVHLLSNRYTPRKNIIKCLREVAGRVRVPKLSVELDKSMLLELPPVMRLKLLESLLIHMRSGHVKFTDISTEEELKPLLFGTAIKYNSRVEQIVRRFKFICT